MALKFTTQFKIKNKNVEFIDIPVDNKDLLAFIDPFLIEKNKSDRLIRKINIRLRDFFAELNKAYIKTNDLKNGIPFLDHLHEPNEYHLGYSSTNKGKAVSNSKAKDIFYALRNNRFARQGFSVTNEAHNVLLLVDGIGQDIMSDIIANVCRDIFSDFTRAICSKHGISTQTFDIDFYNSTKKKWGKKKTNLPQYNSHLILIPNSIVSGKREYSARYNWFISSNYLSKEVLNKKKLPNSKMVVQMKDGTRKAIVKEIYKHYRKPKKDLIDFVLKYPDSLDEFIEYAKEHYPELDLGNIK